MLKIRREILNKADRVAVLVASSPIDAHHMQRGHEVMAELGLTYLDEDDAFYGRHYLSKNASLRAETLMRCLHDDEVDAIWLARGGYGANLILPYLEKALPPTRRKPIYGSSDGCYLLWYLMERWGLPVYLAPMIYAAMTLSNGYDTASLNWALFGAGTPPVVHGHAIDDLHVRGTLHGGCLSILVSLIHTPFMPRLSGSLLIIEDINERPYRLERMLWQLLTSGSLQGVAAVLFGQFPGCFRDVGEKEHFYERMGELLDPLSIPFVFDFPLGHAQRMQTVPLGLDAQLSACGGEAKLRLDQFD